MNVDVLLLADYASVDQAYKINVMGIYTIIYAGGFPAVHNDLYVVAILSASRAELGNDRRLVVKILGTDGEDLFTWERKIEGRDDYPPTQVRLNQILRVRQVVFPRAGTYGVSLLVDNDEKGHLTFDVVQYDTQPRE